MRKLLHILFAITILSCKEASLKTRYDLYNEWRWEETYSNPAVPYKTSAGLDTTFYYRFLRNGILQIKDNEKKVISERDFQISQDKLLTINHFRYIYSIDSNKLKIQNVDGIISWTTIFKIEK